MSNLQLRIISGVILASVILAVTWLGGTPFRIVAAFIAGAVFYEWTRMVRPTGSTFQTVPADMTIAAICLALVLPTPFWLLWVLTGVMAAILLAAGATRLDGRWHAAGLFYAAASGITLAFLRNDDQAGLTAILFLFAVVWATDILAYFTGRAIGGPKLAPKISPGKTWSGAFGGTVGAVAVAMLALGAMGQAPTVGMAGLALLLSAVSQAGDLFESWVKRRNGVKDSGHLIPGHGGVMDRVDGLVAAAFALYVIGGALSGFGSPAKALFGL
ncbi:phosphatidate cytidylyltransferase [Mesorhizobium sp. NBSH29]|uniref:phosphatidate cytidylyltransferase n=1 Tax=Mesorhizobium sp. NBSH29 TaxID=2654249 RepID=UPI0018967459|nr:phosphatidate cytidylyltransferase [Mesorhizobium sp. NBSH29]QPC88709.1 phosphatidate cytidylyltransferase [Mesorhizobium sp. NBSH29]